MISFTSRNLRVFFRDRAAVFFSLLASLIILSLYVLFLGDVWTSSVSQFANARELMDNWVMAGLLSVTSATTTMGAFGTMVNDRARKIDKDFYSSPVSRGTLAGGYVLSAFLIGLIISLVTLVLAEIYIVAEGGAVMSLTTLLKVLALILLADYTNTSMVFLVTSFFTSHNAFATASTVIGTLIGFITGIYLPIGMLPNSVQWVIKLFPTAHAGALLRQTMMAGPMSSAFSGVPAENITQFKEWFGVVFKFGGSDLSAISGIIVLLVSGAVFFGLAVLNISRKKR